MATDVVDFNEEVIEASFRTPVLVDFWAPWCGPCRVLGPVLDRLAGENEGRWKLAKVNTDEQQELSMQYGIRGIPAVKLIVDGEVVDEFTGALPEHQIRQWLDQALPTEDVKQVGAAEQALARGDREEARRLLEDLYAHDAGDDRVRLLLAQAVVLEDAKRAAALVDGIEPPDAIGLQLIEGIKVLADAYEQAGDPATLPEGNGREAYAAALEALKRSDIDGALQQFIAAIMADRYYLDDASRKICVVLFALLGTENPLTKKHRRMFEMALY